MSKYDIGIVIVNYNVRHFLTQCLQSIRNSELRDLKLEIWVVDNASLDGSVGLIKNDFPEVHLIANENNLGFSVANNQAIRQMDAKYILLLNPDTVLEEDTLHSCYDFMEDHLNAGALGVKMIDGAGKFLPESKRQIPDIWNSFCKLSYLSELFPRSRWFSGYNLGYLPENETNEIQVLCGAFMFMRSEALLKTGLLDENFFMYGEDIDLSYRIIRAGYKIYYFPETSIIHYKGESTKKSSLNYVKTFYGAMHIYVNKHYGQGNAKNFARFIRFAIYMRAVLSSMSRMLRNWGIPVLDFIFIWILMSNIKNVWAEIYFQDSTYYSQTNIDTVLGAYTLVWVFFLWLSGHYDPKSSEFRTMSGIGLGTLFILIAYALLPEALRTSRALILIGSLVSIFIVMVSRYLFRFNRGSSGYESGGINIAIVAEKINAQKLVHIINSANLKIENIHFISPLPARNDPFFSNDVKSLPKVVKTLKIHEIIYSSEDMSMKDIIHSMTSMESEVAFRIGGDDSLRIIGSKNKNQQGELYSLDVLYKLSDPQNKRYKRLTDIVLSILLVVLIPLLLIINGFKLRLVKNILSVLAGNNTWLGYGGNHSDYSFLPELPAGIIKFPMTTKAISYAEDHCKKMNIMYAKEYNVLQEIFIIGNNLHKLSNRV